MKKGPISPTVLFWFVAVVVVVGTALTIGALSQSELSPSESLLLSLLLTVFSVTSGWLISHTLSNYDRAEQIAAIKREYEKNTEIYAIKASEKVINLSNQISRVVDFLKDQPKDKTETSELELIGRHNAVIHMLGTLKSINDTSLSDWEGVIGDRLDAKRKIDQQRDFDINAILDEMRALSKERIDFTEEDMAALTVELRRLSNTQAALPPSRRGGTVKVDCPVCSSHVRLKTTANGRIRKTAARCNNCNSSLAVINGDSESPYLEKRHDKPEQVVCPECGKANAVLLDNAAPSHKNFNCSSCGQQAVAHRLRDGIQSRTSDGAKKVVTTYNSPQFLEQVYMLMPPQPWPPGAHREVAEKLGCTPSQVNKATRALIKEGRFQNQIDGQLVPGVVEPTISILDAPSQEEQTIPLAE